MATICFQEKVDMKALKSDLICFWLYSLSPASPPALHEACLASYLQFCTCVSPLSYPCALSSLNVLFLLLVSLTTFSSPLFTWLVFHLRYSTPLGMLLEPPVISGLIQPFLFSELTHSPCNSFRSTCRLYNCLLAAPSQPQLLCKACSKSE